MRCVLLFYIVGIYIIIDQTENENIENINWLLYGFIQLT